MAHRIRYAMTQEPLSSKPDGAVEIDEAYVGGRRRVKNQPSNRKPVVDEETEIKDFFARKEHDGGEGASPAKTGGSIPR